MSASGRQVDHPHGRVELVDLTRVDASPLSNHDLAPVPLSRRTWSTYNYAALWISMAHCIPTYMLASGLMASGMSWSQALVTILLGNTIVLVPILLNSHPGTKYGITFPVFARAAYGTFGSNVPARMRALVTILLGNTIVLVPMLLNSHPGTKYGIPFPVFARAAYGTFGSNVPALMRALVACGRFGIQAWIGGEALNTLFKAIFPGWQMLLGGPVSGHTP